MGFHDLIAHFSLVLSDRPSSGCATVHPCAEVHLGCFQALATMNEAAINVVCRFLQEHMFATHLGEYQEARLLGGTVGVY